MFMVFMIIKKLLFFYQNIEYQRAWFLLAQFINNMLNRPEEIEFKIDL